VAKCLIRPITDIENVFRRVKHQLKVRRPFQCKTRGNHGDRYQPLARVLATRVIGGFDPLAQLYESLSSDGTE